MSDQEDTQVFTLDDEEQMERPLPGNANESQATPPEGQTNDSAGGDISKTKGRPRGSSSKSKAQTKDAKYNELKVMFDALSDERDSLLEKKRHLKQDYTDLKAQLDNQIYVNNAQTREIQNLKATNVQLTHKINNLDVVASSLETEKSELAAELRNVQKSVKGLETEKRNLKENNSAILQELSTAQQQLHDCEVEKSELIEQIANVSNTEDNDRKANAIVIYDSISQSLKDNLSHPNMVFEYLHLDLQNPKNVTMKLQNADLVVFALGGKLIEEGVKGLSAYKLRTDVLYNLENQVYVITLPPMALKGVSSQISLFNYK